MAEVFQCVAPPFERMMFHCDGCGPIAARYGITRFCASVFAVAGENPTSSVKWSLVAFFAVEVDGHWVRWDTPAWLPVDKGGRLPLTSEEEFSVPLDFPVPFANMPTISVDLDGAPGKLLRYLLFHPCLFALDLLNTTKNVTLDRLYRIKRSRKELRSSVRLPDLAHHIITIRDSAGGVVEGNRLRSAAEAGAHRVRGHYKTYTDAAPLFGRIVGKFWVPSFIKGLDSGRLITSEYRV